MQCADTSGISKIVERDLLFLLIQFLTVHAKKMFVSYKMIFIKKEAALLCVNIRKGLRAFEAACNLVYNFQLQLLPLQSPVFVVHFSNAFWHGQEAFIKVSSCNEIVALFVIFHLPYSKYRGVKFSLVSHSCRSRLTGVTLVSLVSGTCVVKQTRPVQMAKCFFS